MLYKYDVVILAVFKNEESFLPEWLDHYLNRNIDHIFLLNDNSVDSSVDIINQHNYKNNITLINSNESKDIPYRQKYLYNKYYKYLLEETKWIGIFDLDEFCYSPNTLDLKSIIINDYDKTGIQELIIDWYWFGSNGHIEQPNKIVDSFILRSEYLSKIISEYSTISSMGYHYEWCCKSFAKTKYIMNLNHHYNEFKIYKQNNYISVGKNKNFSVNLSDRGSMFINHYIGSKDYYFLNKVYRGSCNNSIELSNNKIQLYDMINLNQVKDDRLSQQNKLFLKDRAKPDDT